MNRRLLISMLWMLGFVLPCGANEPAASADTDRVVAVDSWWLPPNFSEHGGKIDAIFELIFWVTLITMIAVLAVLGWFLVKYRYRPGRKAVFIHGSHKLEMIWTITPAVMLVVMGILSIRVWADIRFDRPKPGEDVTEIEVLAQQFLWNVRYPGDDRRFGTPDDLGSFAPEDQELEKARIRNIIHVPVGKTVLIHLSSKDVLHSFFVPNMRQKLDAVPGLAGELWFKPTEPGRYEIACAELCGPQHYAMRGELIVMRPEDYKAWYEGEYAPIREVVKAAAESEHAEQEDHAGSSEAPEGGKEPAAEGADK